MEIVPLLSLTRDGAQAVALDLGDFAILLDCGLSPSLSLTAYMACHSLLARVKLVVLSQGTCSHSGALPFVAHLLHSSWRVAASPVAFNLAPCSLHEQLIMCRASGYALDHFRRASAFFENRTTGEGSRQIRVKPWQHRSVFQLGVGLGCCGAGFILGATCWLIELGVSTVLYLPLHSLNKDRHLRQLDLEWLKAHKQPDLLLHCSALHPAHPLLSQQFALTLKAAVARLASPEEKTLGSKPRHLFVRVWPQERCLEVLAEIKQLLSEGAFPLPESGIRVESGLNATHFNLLKDHHEFMRVENNSESSSLLKFFDSCSRERSRTQSPAQLSITVGGRLLHKVVGQEDIVLDVEALSISTGKGDASTADIQQQIVSLDDLPMTEDELAPPSDHLSQEEIALQFEKKEEEVLPSKSVSLLKASRIESKPFLRFRPKDYQSQSFNSLGELVPEEYSQDERVASEVPVYIPKIKKTSPKKELQLEDFVLKEEVQRSMASVGQDSQRKTGYGLSSQRDCQLLLRYIGAKQAVDMSTLESSTRVQLCWRSKRIHLDLQTGGTVQAQRVRGCIEMRTGSEKDNSEEEVWLQVHESESLRSTAKIEEFIKMVRRVKAENAQLHYSPSRVTVKGFYGESFFQLREQALKLLKR